MAGYLTPEGHARVSAAVGRAELKSSGEIVTIVADRSDGYTDVALAWATLVAFLLMALVPLTPDLLLQPLAVFHGGWNIEWEAGGILAAGAALGIVSFLLVLGVQFWTPLKFMMIPGRIKTDRAENRAIELFKVGAERRTYGRTGIVIYLSMQEHRAEIVADQAIVEKVEPEVWGDAMAAMLERIRQGDIAGGIVAAVDKVGDVLAQHFPRAEDDQNELPDRLIEI